MELVDPDDRSLDFHGDVYYEAPSQSGQAGKIHSLKGLSGATIAYQDIWTGNTLVETLQAFAQVREVNLNKYLNDVRWLKFISIRQEVRMAIDRFHRIRLRYPRDVAELLQSGLTPIDSDSVNPLTGQPFYLDGRALDFYYGVSADGNNYSFYHTEENAQRAQIEFTP
jgi:hypothetical protein